MSAARPRPRLGGSAGRRSWQSSGGRPASVGSATEPRLGSGRSNRRSAKTVPRPGTSDSLPARIPNWPNCVYRGLRRRQEAHALPRREAPNGRLRFGRHCRPYVGRYGLRRANRVTHSLRSHPGPLSGQPPLAKGPSPLYILPNVAALVAPSTRWRPAVVMVSAPHYGRGRRSKAHEEPQRLHTD